MLGLLRKEQSDHCAWSRVSNGKKGEIKTEQGSEATSVGACPQGKDFGFYSGSEEKL